MTRFRFDPAILPRLVVWTLLFGLLTPTKADPDLWGHVRFGLDMLQTRALTRDDPYSFASDLPWINHEWLAELAMGAAYAGLGAVGLGLLKLAVLIPAFVLVGLELRAQRMVADLLLGLAVLGCLPLASTVRPQVFSILLFTGLLVYLRRLEDGHRAALVAVPLLMALWANLHGGWLVGFGVLGIWTAIRVVSPSGVPRVAWSTMGIAGLAATLATPYGVGLWGFLWRTVGLERPDITEWQPVHLAGWQASTIWLLLVGTATLALARSRASRITHVATVIVLAAMSARVVRLIPFLSVATVCLLGSALRPAMVRPAGPVASGSAAAAVLAVFVAGALGGAAAFAQRNLPCIDAAQPWSADRTAARAIADLPGESGRLLVWFDWGEYAIWHLAPRFSVAIDGRRETVYSAATLSRFSRLFDAGPGWQAHLEELDPSAVWLRPDLALAGELGRLGWHRAFTSPTAVVFTHQAATPLPAAPAPGPRCFPE